MHRWLIHSTAMQSDCSSYFSQARILGFPSFPKSRSDNRKGPRMKPEAAMVSENVWRFSTRYSSLSD
jgi:hypothetical protein